MINLIEQIQKAKEAEEEYRKLEKKVDSIREKVWKVLEFKYQLLLSSQHQSDYRWDSSVFNGELQLILRSMLKRDRVFKVPAKENEEFNLTSQHGLKHQRTWNAYDFLPYRNKQYPVFKNEKYSNGDYIKIDFSVLRNVKHIDIEKLGKFFYFLRKILGLYALREKIEDEFEKNFEGSKNLDKIKHLGSYSGLDSFAEFLLVEPILAKFYESYANNLRDFKDRSAKVLKKLEGFNKPFRVFLKLREDRND